MSIGRKAVVPVLTEVLQVPAPSVASTSPLKDDAAVAPVAPTEPEAVATKPATAATPYRETPADVVETISILDEGSSLVDAPAPGATAAAPMRRFDTAPSQDGASADHVNALVERVLTDVQRQVDLLIEHRLARALEPSIDRLTQAFAIEARHALHTALREVVERAVRQELDRIRAGG